jgi:hypothetical protein
MEPIKPLPGYRNTEAEEPEAVQPLQPVGRGDYLVQDGDSLESIAFERGFFHETLWNHPQNTELRQTRRDHNVLLPGDRVFIPEKVTKTVTVKTGASYKFRKKGVPATLRLQLLVDGAPRANQPYSLKIDDRWYEGVTDAQGFLVQSISPDARTGRLVVGPDQATYNLRFGSLRPIEDLLGLQQRLINLGYLRPPATEELDPATIAALRDFQRAEGLQPTGAPDDETQRRLLVSHDDV